MLKKGGLLVLLLLIAGAFCARAAVRPEWTWKDESTLNRKRKNTSYEFKVFKTEDKYLSRLQEGRFYPLLEYLGGKYGADINTMSVDSLSTGPGAPVSYRIVFPDNGHDATVWAQRVDVFSTVDNNTLGEPIFEYYQLYAVSEKDQEVLFDHYVVKERSRAVAALMDFVPGTGQMYKGHTFKGGVILGSELLLGAAAISTHSKSLYYRDMVASGASGTGSWQSKEIGMRRLRNLSLCAMAGVWVFSVYDAIAKESMPFVSVSAPEGGTLSVAPATDVPGLALVYRF